MTFHVTARQMLRFTVAIKADSKAEAIRKLKAAYDDGDFDPFLDYREEDDCEGDGILNFVMSGEAPTFESEEKT